MFGGILAQALSLGRTAGSQMRIPDKPKRWRPRQDEEVSERGFVRPRSLIRTNRGFELIAVLTAVMLVLVLHRADAAFPGNNGKLAFTSVEYVQEWGNIQEIHAMYPDSIRTNLSKDDYTYRRDSRPAWSPDGKSIAFTAMDDWYDYNPEIYVMSADGTGRTNLSNNSGQDSDPAWSPDGKKIAFTTGSEIHVMNAADGSGQTNLGVGSDPAWSPDGSKIAFDNGTSDIYVMNVDGTGVPINLTANAAGDVEPAWSSDGKKIVFRTNRDGNNEIYVMNADGTGQTNLTKDSHSDVQPTWSPDGGKIAFATDRQSNYSESVWYETLAMNPVNHGNSEIFVMNADGSGQTNVTKTEDRTEHEPDWQALPGGNDTSPPETEITSVTTDANTAKFGLGSSEPGSTFECRLDADPFAPCQPPASYDGLTLGDHTFQVRARDAAGNPDPEPAAHTWTVSDVLPETWIGDLNWGCNGKPNCYAFWFRSPQSDSTFECRLSPVETAFTACWSPAVYYVTSSGAYTFEVRAKDTKGRVDPSPDTERFDYTAPADTRPPETTIDTNAGPSNPTVDNTATFVFASDEPGSTFKCRLDADPAGFTSCSSPKAYSGLSTGEHTFEVFATDGAGNADPTPATRTWTVSPPSDTTPPTVGTVFPAPGKTGVSWSVNITASFSEPVDPKTITTATVKIVKKSTGTVVAAVVSCPAPPTPCNTITLDPNSSLASSTWYVVTIKAGANGVKDLAGNPLATDKVWKFKTKS